MIVSTHGIIASSGIPFIGLLDTYPNAAAAYSLRKLRSAYSGFAIRVRRSSDNTSTNIGFDVNGNLDTTSLLSFVGSSNGFVTTWFDQSGNNRNLTQTTAAVQPRIVNAGVIDTLNGKPSVYNNGTTTNPWVLSVDFGTTLSQPNTIFNIGSNSNQAAAGYLWDGISLSARNGLFTNNGNSYNLFAGNIVTISATLNINTQRLLFAKYNAASSLIAVNAGSGVSGNPSTQSLTGIRLNAAYNGGTASANTHHQEFILWNADKITDRTGISNNINSYYSTY
jgi:hypothetical protein